MRIGISFLRASAALVATAAIIAGCSGSDAAPVTGADGGGPSSGGSDAATPPAVDDAGTGGDGADAAVAPSAYPSGPYGVAVGAVIANLSWVGYVSPAADAIATTKPYGAYSLDDARRSGKRYAMINLAE